MSEQLKEITKEQMFEALSNAQKLYERYLELQAICEPFNKAVFTENYERDMSHPLSIAIKDSL